MSKGGGLEGTGAEKDRGEAVVGSRSGEGGGVPESKMGSVVRVVVATAVLRDDEVVGASAPAGETTR